MAIQPGPGNHQGGTDDADTAELVMRPGRTRHPGAAMLLALVALGGLAVAGFGIAGQLRPRTFTAAQKQRIEAWEIAKRWRTAPKTEIFPAVIRYQLIGQVGAPDSLKLTARRLDIAGQSNCARAAGASKKLLPLLVGDGCQAVLRATYTDASSSLVVTVGVAVLRNGASATAVAHYLTGGVAAGPGAIAHQIVLSPVPVRGTPAASFGFRQRQLSWVAASGSYLVLASVGYADGRPRVPVASDGYTFLEMTSLARGVVSFVAAPLGARPSAPHCPGGPAC
jgi:hypothetical protein